MFGLMCNRLMRGAGTALPIFARKRPRMALMAFSNSQSAVNSDHATQHHRQDKNSFVGTAAEEKENAGGYNQSGRETIKWR